jgi:hypothetical protein
MAGKTLVVVPGKDRIELFLKGGRKNWVITRHPEYSGKFVVVEERTGKKLVKREVHEVDELGTLTFNGITGSVLRNPEGVLAYISDKVYKVDRLEVKDK